MKKVNYTFKFLYAIGIILVVAGHCQNAGFSLFYEYFPIYTFHMGLFMFVSGYFYKAQNENNVKSYIIGKIKHLLVPLYLWNIFYAFVVEILQEYGFIIGGHVKFYTLVIEPLWSGHQFEYNLAGWFVIPLFMIQVYNICIRKFFAKFKLKEWMYFCLNFSLGIIGIALSSKGDNYHWWFLLTRMLTLLPYYSLGILYKKYEKFDHVNSLVYFSVIFIIALGFIYKYGAMPTSLHSWCQFSHGCVVPFLVGILGIAFWLRVAKILTPITARNKYIDLIADNTYVIMINHLLGFMILKTIYACIHKYTSFAVGFDMNLYKSNIWYFYIPHNLNQFLILYLLFGIAFSLCMAFIIAKMKMYLVNFKKKCYNHPGDKKELYK